MLFVPKVPTTYQLKLTDGQAAQNAAFRCLDYGSSNFRDKMVCSVPPEMENSVILNLCVCTSSPIMFSVMMQNTQVVCASTRAE